MSLVSRTADILKLIRYFPVPMRNIYMVASTLSYLPILLIFALLRHSPLSRYLSWVFPGNSFYAFILNKFYFLRQLSRSVEIHEFDELYPETKGWLGENLAIKEEQALEARAQGFSTTAIEYQPQLPTTTILHYRNIFYAIEFDRINKPGSRESTEIIRTRTAGWNVYNIDRLLQEVRASANKNGGISIYRNTYVHSCIWAYSCSKPKRSFASIALDTRTKEELIGDLKEYLNPKTRKWYRERGMPYRRGYLLEGPPGTGKSSVSFIIASSTGLPLFVLVLTPEMNDNDLSMLFQRLPQHCIVLIEDVDAIAIHHNTDTTSKNGGVSLAGLLNVLDGIYAQEGRIVVMTTNHSEKLDRALIRPGRVDRIFHFTVAGRDTARQLFFIIYMKIPENASGLGEIPVLTEPCLAGWSTDDIEILANIFSQEFEGCAPCEIKNYLEQYRHDPARAVTNVLGGPSFHQISHDTSLTSLGTSRSLVVIDKLPYTTTITLFIHSPVGYLLFRSSPVCDSHDSWEPHRGKILLQDASLGGAISREIRSLIGLDCTKIHHYHVVVDSPDSEQLYTLNFYVLAHVSQTADPKGESFRFRWMVPDESQADIDGQTLDALRVLQSKSGHKHGS